MPNPLKTAKNQKRYKATSTEEKFYEVLHRAYAREDAAAKAAARLESDIVTAYQLKQSMPIKNMDEAPKEDGPLPVAPHEFNKSDFHETFSKLNFLRTVTELVDVLELGSVSEKIATNLVDDLFGNKRAPVKGKRVGATSTVIGDDQDAMIATLRDEATRRKQG